VAVSLRTSATVMAGSITRQPPSGPVTTVVVVRYNSLVATSTPGAISAICQTMRIIMTEPIAA